MSRHRRLGKDGENGEISGGASAKSNNGNNGSIEREGVIRINNIINGIEIRRQTWRNDGESIGRKYRNINNNNIAASAA